MRTSLPGTIIFMRDFSYQPHWNTWCWGHRWKFTHKQYCRQQPLPTVAYHNTGYQPARSPYKWSEASLARIAKVRSPFYSAVAALAKHWHIVGQFLWRVYTQARTCKYIIIIFILYLACGNHWTWNSKTSTTKSTIDCLWLQKKKKPFEKK